jgi:pyruvate/2-oxoglutarate dehydrogenase complex dihydrolipoamide dehydrogenase (E3) component
MAAEHVQNLVIGSGVAGKLLAWGLAKQGQKTVVVERSMIGGSCPNVACLPSKNVIYSAKAVSLVHPTTGLGVISGSVHVDMPAVVRRKRQMIDGLIELHLHCSLFSSEAVNALRHFGAVLVPARGKQ